MIKVMSAYEDKFFNFNIKILKLAGVWYLKYDQTGQKIFFFIYNCFILIYALILFQSAEIYFVVTHTSDLRNLSKNVAWTVTHILLTCKVILWFSKRHIVINIKETLQKSEFYYENTKNFKPSEILDKFEKLNYAFIATHFWIGLLIPMSACFGTIFSVYFDVESVNGKDENGNVIFCEKLPFTTYIPFNITTKFRCCFASLMQSQGILFFGNMIISLDAIFTSTMCFLTAHINILQEAFKSVRGRALKKLIDDKKSEENLNDLNKYLNIEMNKCIHYLQTIIRLCESLESVYRFQTLAQAMDILLVFCVNLYLVSSISLEDKSFMSEITYMMAVGIEFSLYCWFGNELTLASAEIPQALYESDWTIFPIEVQRSLLITMIRMKKPIAFTVGMFSPLTLGTLVSILRASYSFFAVLKQVNE